LVLYFASIWQTTFYYGNKETFPSGAKQLSSIELNYWLDKNILLGYISFLFPEHGKCKPLLKQYLIVALPFFRIK